jgi:hypothetical protein
LNKIALIVLLSGMLGSCSIYKSDFDCPVGHGVGCKSISEIESMILESKKGPDLFLGMESVEESSNCGTCKSSTKSKKSKSVPNSLFVTEDNKWVVKDPQKIRRVWISPHSLDSGAHVEGHYVYFSEGGENWHVVDPKKGSQDVSSDSK